MSGSALLPVHVLGLLTICIHFGLDDLDACSVLMSQSTARGDGLT
jgi:hypothetical protein